MTRLPMAAPDVAWGGGRNRGTREGAGGEGERTGTNLPGGFKNKNLNAITIFMLNLPDQAGFISYRSSTSRNLLHVPTHPIPPSDVISVQGLGQIKQLQKGYHGQSGLSFSEAEVGNSKYCIP